MSQKKLLDFLKFRPTEMVSVAGTLGGEGKLSRIAQIWTQSGATGRPTYDDLMNAESELGRTLFGPIPEGYQREFFKHRQNVWIWHESYLDTMGVLHEMTVRYEVKPTGVFKKVPGVETLIKLEGTELDNFREAARRYLDLVKLKLYC